MPAKASCEEKVRMIHQRQKNGDTYVIERRTVYDPDKKYNRVLSSRIVSKIPKGQDDPVPTRPKRKNGERGQRGLGVRYQCSQPSVNLRDQSRL